MQLSRGALPFIPAAKHLGPLEDNPPARVDPCREQHRRLRPPEPSTNSSPLSAPEAYKTAWKSFRVGIYNEQCPVGNSGRIRKPLPIHQIGADLGLETRQILNRQSAPIDIHRKK